jgi:1-acyl-sn-glycerol-3-phosphate acyltransferase
VPPAFTATYAPRLVPVFHHDGGVVRGAGPARFGRRRETTAQTRGATVTVTEQPQAEAKVGATVPPEGVAIRRAFQVLGEAVARWTRLEYEGPDELPEAPALIVANHGFGGIFDPNVLAIAAITKRFGIDVDTPATLLMHQAAWTIGVGRFFEPAGFRPAGSPVALAALARGESVFVIPGGDVDAAKPFHRRNEIVFDGRTGFAQIAIDAGVPIVPLVVTGAGETAIVLSDGRRLARALRLPQLARTKTLPISISVPWGLSVGVAGLAPYLPLPAKMRAAVLPAMYAEPGEDAAALAARVHAAMSARARELTDDRLPFLGWKRFGATAGRTPGHPKRSSPACR